LFLNGKFFHHNRRRGRMIRLAKDTMPFEFLRANFVKIIVDLGDIVFRIKNNLLVIDFVNEASQGGI